MFHFLKRICNFLFIFLQKIPRVQIIVDLDLSMGFLANKKK